VASGQNPSPGGGAGVGLTEFVHREREVGPGVKQRDFPIRPATETDLPRIAELIGLNRNEPFALESLLDFEAKFPEAGTKRMLVIECGRTVVCWGRAMRMPHDEPERRQIDIATLPAYRRKGLGTAMLEALVQVGMTDSRTSVRDDDPESLRFAERHGFVRYRHVFESRLDLDAVDLDLVWQAIERAERNGVRFFSFAETAMDEDATRRLWAVNSVSNLDQPGQDESKPNFEDWCSMVTQSSWFDPGGQILAAVGDEWVGLGAVGTFSPGCFYNLYTGVLKPHRGQCIATALKALGIRYAQSRDGKSIRTNNNAENAPMLAINRRFGYVPLPGWYTLRKEINLAS
jgi:GNAT superfamily N-acetyltransferase